MVHLVRSSESLHQLFSNPGFNWISDNNYNSDGTTIVDVTNSRPEWPVCYTASSLSMDFKLGGRPPILIQNPLSAIQEPMSDNAFTHCAIWHNYTVLCVPLLGFSGILASFSVLLSCVRYSWAGTYLVVPSTQFYTLRNKSYLTRKLEICRGRTRGSSKSFCG